MARKWPQFVTRDIADTDEGAAEMQRRWEAYDRAMKKIIAGGGVHQDEDGWWIEDATGELIGPDPEIERPLSVQEMKIAKPATAVLPAEFFERLDEARKRRGRPKLDAPKIAVTLRVDPDVLERFKATGKDWRARMNEALRKAAGV